MRVVCFNLVFLRVIWNIFQSNRSLIRQKIIYYHLNHIEAFKETYLFIYFDADHIYFERYIF